jgi:hypothetical protein
MGSLDYAQARLSARYGQRPDEIAWRRIEHLRELPALLDAARISAFGVWLVGIGPTSTAHQIEGLLRDHWRSLVAEVAAWMPDEWQPAVRWCAVAADLPVVQHLARGETALPWMPDDAVYRELAERDAAGPGALPAEGPFAPLRAAWTEPAGLGNAWRAEWRRRVPAVAGDDVTLLDELGRVLHRHLAAFRDPSVRDGWPLRRALEARLVLLFRRAMLDPAAAFIYLVLTALDLERLRGELVRRAAFPGMAPLHA